MTVGLATNPSTSYSPNLMVLKEPSVLGSISGTKRELRELVEFARAGKVRSTVTDRIALDEVNEGLALLEKGAIAGKCCMVL